MKFYNYEKLYLLAHGAPNLILQYFRDSENDGYDFILNPKDILMNLLVSDQHKAEYIGLCSLRNYEAYLDRKETNLHLDLVPPWVDIKKIKDNPLIKVTDNYIILKKENK